MGLGDMFDQVFSSCRIGYPKPSKGYFESIVYKLESTPSSILLWDDRPHNIEEARRFGLSAELYTDYDTFVGKMKENIPSLSDSL